MRPLRAVPCVLVLVSLFPAVSAADDFSDFRIPDHRASATEFSVFGTGDHRSDEVTGFARRMTDWSGQGSGQASWLWDSDPREWDLVIRGSGQGFRQHARTNEYFSAVPGTSFASDESQRASGTFESWTVGGGARLYPGIGLLAFDLRGAVSGQESQQWNTASRVDVNVSPGFDQRTESQAHEERWSYQETATLDVGLGWGRVRDATPVFQAILLEERLDRDHALGRPLSHEGRQRLAELFSLRGTFSLVHDLPDKFFWGDVERILREDGALDEGGLTAHPLRHADDPLVVARGFVRNAGFFVRPVVSGRHVHIVDRRQQRTGDRFFSNGSLVSESLVENGDRFASHFEQTFYGAQAEYHRPLGVRTQFDAAERVLVDLRGDPDALLVSGDFAFGHVIAERWFLSAGFTHTRELQNRSSTWGLWTTQVHGSLSWYVEDYLALSLGASENESHQRPARFFSFPPPPGPLDSEVNRAFQVTLGGALSWGRLAAPGLGVDERSMR